MIAASTTFGRFRANHCRFEDERPSGKAHVGELSMRAMHSTSLRKMIESKAKPSLDITDRTHGLTDANKAGLAGLERSGTLVMDDFLYAIARTRRSYALPNSNFDLKNLASYTGALSAIEALVTNTIDFHAGDISAKRCPLLNDLGSNVYGAAVKIGAYSGYRIAPESVEPVLRRALELGLQTIAQLPRRTRTQWSSKPVLSLASALMKLGSRVTGAARGREFSSRVITFLGKDHTSFGRLPKLGEEMQWAGKTLQGVAKAKMRKQSVDHPNPQVKWALYLTRWIESATGRPNYEHLRTLLHATFHSAHNHVPKWVNRLEIERHLQKKLRGRQIEVVRV
jgi:hypothetical protein